MLSLFFVYSFGESVYILSVCSLSLFVDTQRTFYPFLRCSFGDCFSLTRNVVWRTSIDFFNRKSTLADGIHTLVSCQREGELGQSKTRDW